MSKKKIGVGIIGTGRRGYSLGKCIAELREETGFEITALWNRTGVRMAETKTALIKTYSDNNISPDITLYENYEDLINDFSVDLIMIVTSQSAHRSHAVPALRSGKKVFLDKPIAHNLKDAITIFEEESKTKKTMFMGFTRRYENSWTRIFDLVKDGIIGDVKMMLIRAVIPYHVYFHTWVRRKELSGGALADKMSHYFDVFNWFAQGRPERLSACGGQSVFLPDPEAPGRCPECDRDCPYRAGQKEEKTRQDSMEDFGESRSKETDITKRLDNCVWLPGADINDHGIVNISYPEGIKASLFWCIFGPDTDDQETFEIVGNRGRIILTRHSGMIDVVGDYGKYHKVLDEKEGDFSSSHFGADHKLIFELNKFYDGSAPVVTGRDGLEAARIVEASHRSINSGGNLILMKDIENA